MQPTNLCVCMCVCMSVCLYVCLCVCVSVVTAIMHLYYARFISHFLHDVGVVPSREPFINLLTQGMVMGRSCRLKQSGKYLQPHQVDWSGRLTLPYCCLRQSRVVRSFLFASHSRCEQDNS